MNIEVKQITIIEKPQMKLIKKKEKEKRVVTKTKKWDSIVNPHYEILLSLKESFIGDNTVIEAITPQIALLLNQLKYKIAGYKCQDQKKKLFDQSKFITLKKTIDLLIMSELSCFYCKEKTILLYEDVREPKQWSLERINNQFGHNQDNVEIACLSCNVKRRTMRCERFIFSTECKNIKKLENYCDDDTEPITE